MIVTRTSNLIPPSGETPAQAAQLQNFVSSDPRYSSLQYLRNAAWTQYTALQTRIAYNRGGKLHLGLSYTLSHTTSDELSDQIGGGTMTNPYDISVDDGPANYDRRHTLNLDGMYNLPFRISLSGLYSFGSPLPWNVTSINDTFFRPEPRNSRRAGNLNTTSVRFSKAFKIRERLSATVMWEVFNLFNTDYFYGYAGSLQSSSFGTPGNDLPKRAQQGAFRIDF
jgi:hypothetical protein